MSIEVLDESGRDVDVRRLSTLARFVMDRMRVHALAELCIKAVDEQTIAELNAQWMEKEGPTDVLAFPLWTSAEKDAEVFYLPPEETTPVGEIVISYPQAARQAREGKRPIRSEMALLIVHGVLHLLGYDHVDSRQEDHMWAKQDEVLAKIPLK